MIFLSPFWFPRNQKDYNLILQTKISLIIETTTQDVDFIQMIIPLKLGASHDSKARVHCWAFCHCRGRRSFWKSLNPLSGLAGCLRVAMDSYLEACKRLKQKQTPTASQKSPSKSSPKKGSPKKRQKDVPDRGTQKKNKVNNNELLIFSYRYLIW